METFFKTIKAELIWRHSWQTRRDIEVAIFEYINGFYNPCGGAAKKLAGSLFFRSSTRALSE